MAKILKDRLSVEDRLAQARAKHPQTLWARTRVIGGYGLTRNQYGISALDEVVFDDENIVPIGGVQYAMEMIFGVKGSLEIPELNDTALIGAQDTTITGTGGNPYAYGQKVCLFGVGTGGAAENNITKLEDKYNEYTVPDLIPLRYTSEALTEIDRAKYFGKKIIDNTTAYYLKKFDTDPVIRHLFKNGEDGEDGSEVDSSIFLGSTSMGIESFTETCLTISKKDVREWFNANGNIEESRINSIGLFTAVYDPEAKDYAHIQLFSKLNIPTEPLSLTKDMNIIYRVYGA